MSKSAKPEKTAAPESPDTPDPDSPDEAVEQYTGIEDLIDRLRARVAERRESGDYPEGLEEELEQHFRRIVFHRTQPDVDQLKADVNALDSHMNFSRANMPIDSDMPGGELIHRTINKALARNSEGILQQVQEFADAVRRAIRTLSATVQDPNSHTHGDLIGHLDAVLERLTSYERAPVDNESALGDLRRRVEELERAEAARQFKPWFTNEAFEEHFRDTSERSTKEQIFEQYDDLAEEVKGFYPVIDIGCGRGEFLELLQTKGTECWGVEIDPALAELATANGLKVEAGDGLKILASLDDNSVGAIVLLQVIEHLTIQQQLDLVALAYEKLKVTGRLVVETVNPQSLYVYAHVFYLDPTHTRPVHPAYLSFLMEEAGFEEVRWQWRNPPPPSDILEPESDKPNSAANRNVERLNKLLFDSGDYALIARK